MHSPNPINSGSAICGSCGSPVSPTAKFCTNCGAQFSDTAIPPNPAEASFGRRPNSYKRPAIITATILGALLLIGLLWFAFNRRADEPRTVTQSAVVEHQQNANSDDINNHNINNLNNNDTPVASPRRNAIRQRPLTATREPAQTDKAPKAKDATVERWTSESETLSHTLSQHPDWRVTYKKSGRNWFVVSGYEGDQIFYQKTKLNKQGARSFLMKYPRSEKRKYQAMNEKLSRNF